jgi:hypothetical protein
MTTLARSRGGGEAVRPNDEEDEEDGDGGPPEGVRDLSSSHLRIGRGYIFITVFAPVGWVCRLIVRHGMRIDLVK